MLAVTFHKVFFIILLSILHFHCLSVNCVIPSLSVKKVNSKLIERKRQDTLEICRLFNEENSQRQTSTATVIKSNVNNDPIKKHRIKRDIDSNKIDSPVLRQEDILRVEKIVDNLYDDLEENGNRITYRHRNVNNVIQEMKKKPKRRFFFRPVNLLGPQDKSPEETTVDNSTTTTTPQPASNESLGPINWNKKWKRGILPYFIDPNTYDALLSEIIIKAFDYFEKVTCIRLQRLHEKPIDKQSLESVEWLYITNPSGIRQCVHSNEQKRNTGVQMVVLGYDCLSQGEIAHEVMHVLGFSHEHTRSDRDRYISILWDNIKPGYKKYFETRDDDPLLSLPYDYASVLHYPPRAFSKNGQVTVMAKTDIKVGQREALSALDVEKIGLIYGRECIARNQDYLLKTCPSVVKNKKNTKKVTAKAIEEYFKDIIWPFGIVNYKLKDRFQFTAEERENIRAVFDHIEKETCIKFRDITNNPQPPPTFLGIKTETEIDKTKEESTIKPEDIGVNDTNMETEIDKAKEESTITPEDIGVNDINADTEIGKAKEESTIRPEEIGVNDINTDTEIDQAKEESTITPEDIGVNDTNTETEIDKAREESTITPDKETEKTIEGNTDVEAAVIPKKLKLTSKLYELRRVTPSHTRSDSSDELEGMKTKKSNKAVLPKSPSRRHAINSIVLSRSTEPGCQCPPAGKPNGNQTLKINGDCFNSVNDLLHLFVHVLGLEHQHKMHDRDSFLHIEWDKLTPEIKEDIEGKLPAAAAAGFAYDYQSVMHYPWLRIKNGLTNIMYPIWNDGWAMGNWQGLSLVDVQKLDLIYADQCKKRKENTNYTK